MTLTPPPVVTGGKQITEEEHFRALLGGKAGDRRPALVYFHWAHEAEEVTPEGRESARQCPILQDELVERWEMLFRCIEVDMDPSDRAVAERFGAGKGASIAVLDADLKVVVRSEDFANPRAAIEWFRKTLPAKLPDVWKDVEKQVAEQERTVEEARKLAKKDKLADALALYSKVRASDVRIAEFWEPAYREARLIEERIAREKEPEKAK